MERSGRAGIGADGAEDEVELGSQRQLDRLDATGAGNLEFAREAALEADVGHDVFGSAVLVNHLGAAGCGKIAHLLGLAAEIDRARSQLQVEVDRLALQLADFEFHGKSVKHFPNRRGENRPSVCLRRQRTAS